jgi:hypothetical protein
MFAVEGFHIPGTPFAAEQILVFTQIAAMPLRRIFRSKLASSIEKIGHVRWW